jgi:hypothetical protein
MIDTNTLVGLLSGSLGTILIKEVVNQINKKQDFTRELKKITYSKKLEKAENAVAYYWTYFINVSQMKKSLDVIIEAISEREEKENDVEIIQGIMVKTGDTLTDLAGDKFLAINSIHLYFDLEDSEKWNENDTGNLLKSISETKSIDNSMKFWLNLHDKSNQENIDKVQTDFYWDKAIKLLPAYAESLQKMIDCIEKNKSATYATIQAIKRQLKQY